MSFSSNQIQLEDCPITNGGDRSSCWSQTMTPNADQTCHEHKEMALSSDQPLCRSGESLNYGAQTMAPNTSQTFCEGQMTSTSDSMDGVETTLPIGNQTTFGGQMTPTSDLTNGIQTTSTGNQAFFVGQMTNPSGNQTSYSTQMATLHGDQTSHGSQLTNPRGDQTLHDPQMTNPRGGLTHYTGQVMSLVTFKGSQLYFLDRSPSISNSHLAQEQLPECSSFPLTAPNLTVAKEEDLMNWTPRFKERKNRKTYKCKCGQLFIKTSHLQCHIRKHAGEKPYKCTGPGCQL